jgi:hypothetical protein
VRLTLQEARRLAVYSQGLSVKWGLPAGKEGAAALVEKLGYVQIDTISVVERAHHHTMWCRQDDYAPGMLEELHLTDRRLFEYWAPSVSYLPMSYYRWYLPAMRAYAAKPEVCSWREQNDELVQTVLARTREEGPLSSADFPAPEGFKRTGWWNWKPAKMALEVLYSSGELMVAGRKGFQRVYDLPSRVIPEEVVTNDPSPEEWALHVASTSLRGLGTATRKEILDRVRPRSSKGAVALALNHLVESGEATSTCVDDTNSKEPGFSWTEALDASLEDSDDNRTVHILSPFDNLMSQRERVKRLFGFDYKLESYLPADKRRYGYLSLPILWGPDLVGRLTPKIDRKTAALTVSSVDIESDLHDLDLFLHALSEKLLRFATFNRCETVTVGSVSVSGRTISMPGFAQG